MPTARGAVVGAIVWTKSVARRITKRTTCDEKSNEGVAASAGAQASVWARGLGWDD
jgi:hypothetical protein